MGKPAGYYDPKPDPEERRNEVKFRRPAPRAEVRPEVTAPAQPIDENYFKPKDTAEDLRKNYLAVMRRSKQQRLFFAIAKMGMIVDPYDSELETLATCRKELKKLGEYQLG